ncbi:hypothetical protein BJX68DRAFT_270200 [Aspergillus pseudodeflectus]|uniref:Uncharacterized protein n=1 Tax=Aspergillus pseudodeflectus TaxID=176178 RepID=A0ABR4JTX1_9EURO
MSEISSLDHKEQSPSLRGKHPHLAKFKKHLQHIKEQWGPGLPAKMTWDDEYNFPAGRWAGQGWEPSSNRRS